MSWHTRLIITLLAYLILSRFFSPIDAVAFALLLLVLLSLFAFNLNRVTSSDKIQKLIRSYLEVYFIHRSAGLPIDDALTQMIYHRYSNPRQKWIIFESLREMGVQGEDERVKKTIYLMFFYEEPVPPTRSALATITELIDKLYPAVKEQHAQPR